MDEGGDGARPWSRDRPGLDPGTEALAACAAGLFPGVTLLAHELLGGGRANTNIRLRLGGPPGDVVLRLYQRDPRQRDKEAALHRLLRGRVPLADLLASGATAPVLGLPFAVLSFVPGQPLARRFGTMDPAARRTLGHAAGTTLAAIHGVAFECPGFLDGALRVATPLPDGPGAMAEVCDLLLAEGPASQRLGDDRCVAVRRHLERHDEAIAAWPGDARLVHGDFGASNLLVDGEGAGTRIAAVLDWEFALAASPLLDLGNLIRPPTGEDAGVLVGLGEGYRTVDPGLPDDWPVLARAVDLLAWVDFAGRPAAPADLVAHTCRMVDRILA